MAVVDDAFRYDDPVFKGMLWRNHKEVAHNGKDDDGNGYIDDNLGWDASDFDPDVRPPNERLSEFSHGTSMAGVIARRIREQLGEMEDYPIKLMFVKAISDTAVNLSMQDGYAGVQYALDNNVDIINLSWSGGKLSQADKKVLVSAQQEGVMIVSSVGNYPQKRASAPAFYPSVFGVAGVRGKGYSYQGNYGNEVDIAAATTAFNLGADGGGASVSAALVTSAMALMKHALPSANKTQIKYCLQRSADSIDGISPSTAGQLGAGALNFKGALSCIEHIGELSTGSELSLVVREQPKGVLLHRQQEHSNNGLRQWQIAPKGEYKGIVLQPYVEGLPANTVLEVRAITQPKEKKNLIVWRGLLTDLPVQIRSEHSALSVDLEISSKMPFNFVMHYATENINFSEQFCKGTKTINLNETNTAYTITDGSGDLDYVSESNCKWLLMPKKGYNVKLRFTKLETEFDVDGIHLFRGNTTNQQSSLMRVTGDILPPTVVVEKSSVLVWFVSDKQNQGAGFSFDASLVRQVE